MWRQGSVQKRPAQCFGSTIKWYIGEFREEAPRTGERHVEGAIQIKRRNCDELMKLISLRKKGKVHLVDGGTFQGGAFK